MLDLRPASMSHHLCCIGELNTMAKEHEENPTVMPNGELKDWADVDPEATIDGEYDESHSADESGNFSDIDDQEVDGYLNNEVEKHYKKIIWENVNREYLEEQAVKEAAAAAAQKAFEANFKNCSEDVLQARLLAQSAAKAVAKSRKEMKQKRAHEAKNSWPAQSAAEATGRMLTSKRLESKVNFARLGELFNDLVRKMRIISMNGRKYDLIYPLIIMTIYSPRLRIKMMMRWDQRMNLKMVMKWGECMKMLGILKIWMRTISLRMMVTTIMMVITEKLLDTLPALIISNLLQFIFNMTGSN
ncbi:hypothetical protein VNO77_16850 [Canavalia gladiata]|uniref:Brf1 TBP-binding domain-containing protein n=1 Tax=Canavalia gladiata TaxID=3824 RepID=A0AAN9LLI6_CANGL